MFIGIGIILLIIALLLDGGKNAHHKEEYKKLSKTSLPNNYEYEARLKKRILNTPIPDEYKEYFKRNIAAQVKYEHSLLNELMIKAGYSPTNFSTMSVKNPDGSIFDPTTKEYIWGYFNKRYKPCIDYYNKTGEYYSDVDLLPSEMDKEIDKAIEEAINEHFEKKTD